MRRLLKFNEQIKYSGQEGPSSRQKVLDEIQVARDSGDWAEVQRLLGLLQDGVLESMGLSWKGWQRLVESVAEGKAFVQKKLNAELAQRLQEEPSGGEEAAERESALRQELTQEYFGPDSNFEKIRVMLPNNQGWIPTFLRFYYDQEASLEVLQNLKQVMLDLRDLLGQLRMTPDQYSRLAYSPETAKPGWELLGDDLNSLLERRSGSWLVKALPKDAMRVLIERGMWQGSPVNLQEEFKKASPEQQARLITQGARIEALGKPKFKMQIRKSISGLPTLDAVTEFAKSIADAASSDKGEILEAAIGNPSVNVMYVGPDHYVFSFRSDQALPELCSLAKPWCIQPKWYNPGYAGQFWNYAEGTVQLGILDFTVDSSNNFHTIGVTINPNRSVRTSHDQADRQISSPNGSSDFRQFLKNIRVDREQHSYPQALIDAVDQEFDAEVKIKSQTDSIFKQIGSYAKEERDRDKALILTVQGMLRDMKSLIRGEISKEQASSSSSDNVANQIVARSLQHLRESPILQRAQLDLIRGYTDGTEALPTEADVKIFEIFMEGSPHLTAERLKIMTARAAQIKGVLLLNAKKVPPGSQTPLAIAVRGAIAAFENSTLALQALLEKVKNQSS